ncbi:hypothetical protein Hanom_Chr10g00938191 [Helianthus anomalus]
MKKRLEVETRFVIQTHLAPTSHNTWIIRDGIMDGYMGDWQACGCKYICCLEEEECVGDMHGVLRVSRVS